MLDQLWPMTLTDEEFAALAERIEQGNPTFAGALVELASLEQPTTEEAAELEGALNG